MNATVKQVRKQVAPDGMPSCFLVIQNGREVGLLEKYRDTRTETHPWKAFRGVGVNAKYIGAFYIHDGGRQGAIDAIVGRSPTTREGRQIAIHYAERPVSL